MESKKSIVGVFLNKPYLMKIIEQVVYELLADFMDNKVYDTPFVKLEISNLDDNYKKIILHYSTLFDNYLNEIETTGHAPAKINLEPPPIDNSNELVAELNKLFTSVFGIIHEAIIFPFNLPTYQL